jgi:squalene cyclase
VSLQHEDGHWVFELEADATIPSSFILLQHYLGNIETGLQQRIAGYLRQTQGAHGGWPLFHGGPFDLSASVKAYFALKAAGEPADAPHMEQARTAILARGGARRSSVFARITLALFGEVPWCAVPIMPVEIMLLPRWFPFHLDKISYWSRTFLVPVLVLMALQPRARNPHGVTVRELFVEPPHYPDLDDTAAVGLALDRFDAARYRHALDRASEWIVGMQSRNGGWAAFDADNTHFLLNHIPFADHGALLDPPTADVSARCLGFLAQLGYEQDHPGVTAALTYLRREQEDDGSWFGRWGTNYIYGTWSVLAAFNAIGIAPDAPEVRRAVEWLLAR